MNIVLFGGKNTGRALLDYLLPRETIQAVVVNADDEQQGQWYPSVGQEARAHDIPVLCPTDPNDPRFVQQIEQLQPDMIISAEYDTPLGDAFMPPNMPRHLQVSLCLIDKIRGNFPITWAILKGHKTTGASLYFLTHNADRVEMAGQVSIPIEDTDTARTLYEHVTEAAAELFASAWDLVKRGRVSTREIDLSEVPWYGAAYPSRALDFDGSGMDVWNQIRAHLFEPYPGPHVDIGGIRYEVRSDLPDIRLVETLRETVRRERRPTTSSFD